MPRSSPVPIAVLFGGPSAEHDVSIVSGTAIADALRERGHAVRELFIDLDGRWWQLPDAHRRDDRPPAAYDDPAGLDAQGPQPATVAAEALARLEPRPVVFIALHGPFGEDGTVQGLLDAAGLVYTGAGVTASAVGMDKAVFKRLARGLGLPVVDWREVHARRWADDREGVLAELDAFAVSNGDPRLIVKPARLGSSVGMTIAHVADERGAALDEAFRFDTLALAEKYLAGARDLEVAVLGNEGGALETYGPGEIESGHEFYDYTAKYSPGVSRTRLDASVPEATAALIRKLARDAYRAIGAEGFARVDFFVHDATVYLNEINTIPGFTPISLFPTLPSLAGRSFGEVAERIVELALDRAALSGRARLTPADLPRGTEPAEDEHTTPPAGSATEER